MTTKEEPLLILPIYDKTKGDNFDVEYFLEKQRTIIANELRNIAEKEVCEESENRKECLTFLRKWVDDNIDIEHCLTDDSFLLRFLRVKKYSMYMAQQTLLKYMNFRKKFSHIMCNMDYKDKIMMELLDNGYIYVSPFRDSHGRRIIIYDTSKFDPHKYTSTDLCRIHAITYETLIEEEHNQIFGITHVANVKGANPAFVTLFPVIEFAMLIKWGEQSFPMRHQDINLLNLPHSLKFVLEFALSNMSEKLKDRFSLYNSVDGLSKKIDLRCLPKELGGSMSSKEMIELWKVELESKRQRLLSYDSMNLLSDRGIIRRKDVKQSEAGVGSLPGSFRKLEVD